MNAAFVLLWMLFFHVVADYNLQGWLASAKQKSYWEENAPDELYRSDYVCALLMQSLSWTFMIMLPIAIYNGFVINVIFAIMFSLNVITHALVDNLKANKKCINLWTDQVFHLVQIVLTASLFIVLK